MAEELHMRGPAVGVKVRGVTIAMQYHLCGGDGLNKAA